MLNLLKNAHDKAEGLEGNKLAVVLAVTFVVFLGIGVIINYITNNSLNKNEFFNGNSSDSDVVKYVEETFEEGIITYVDPNFYPGENISFYLADLTGKQIILLRANDQKLEVAEGLSVKVYGKKTQTSDKKKDVLLVERIVVKNSK